MIFLFLQFFLDVYGGCHQSGEVDNCGRSNTSSECYSCGNYCYWDTYPFPQIPYYCYNSSLTPSCRLGDLCTECKTETNCLNWEVSGCAWRSGDHTCDSLTSPAYCYGFSDCGYCTNSDSCYSKDSHCYYHSNLCQNSSTHSSCYSGGSCSSCKSQYECQTVVNNCTWTSGTRSCGEILDDPSNPDDTGDPDGGTFNLFGLELPGYVLYIIIGVSALIFILVVSCFICCCFCCCCRCCRKKPVKDEAVISIPPQQQQQFPTIQTQQLQQGSFYPPQQGSYLPPQQGGYYPPQQGFCPLQTGYFPSPQQGGSFPSQSQPQLPPLQQGRYPLQQVFPLNEEERQQGGGEGKTTQVEPCDSDSDSDDSKDDGGDSDSGSDDE